MRGVWLAPPPGWYDTMAITTSSTTSATVLEQVDWPTNPKTNVCGSKLVCKIK